MCASCELGYKVDIKTGKCVTCQKSNCSLCMNIQNFIFHNFQSFEICSTCNHNYGFLDGKQGSSCEACEQGCLNCDKNSKLCIDCKVDHFLNPDNSKCERK